MELLRTPEQMQHIVKSQYWAECLPYPKEYFSYGEYAEELHTFKDEAGKSVHGRFVDFFTLTVDQFCIVPDWFFTIKTETFLGSPLAEPLHLQLKKLLGYDSEAATQKAIKIAQAGQVEFLQILIYQRHDPVC